jgi:ribosome-associated translation inhibitor RaiA
MPANAPGGPYNANKPNAQEPNRTAMGVSIPSNIPAVTADTNVPDVNDFNAFKQELNRIDMEARGEDTQWLGKPEKRAELAKAMDEVVVAEMKFLRKVAAATNDANTVEAIDLVLKKRQDRLNKLVTKLENEAKEERRQQTGERQPRRTPKAGAGGQEQPQTPRTTNPVRRTRETINQEQ